MANTLQQKILPKKPHFFKVLIDDFHKSIDIPVAFYHKYLEGQKKQYEEAELRSVQGKVWPVKLVGNQIIGKGWTKFYRDHDLRIGNFLVFRHEGNMVFDVIVFEPSACEKRDYNLPLKDEDTTMDEGDENDPMEDDDGIISMRDSNELKGRNHNCTSEEGSGTKLKNTLNVESKLFEQKYNDLEDNEITVGASKEKMKHHRHIVNSGDGASRGGQRHRYVGRVKPYEIRSKSAFLPKNFTRDTILGGKGCNQIRIRDEEDRLWPTELGRTRRGVVFMKAKGWQNLRVGNNLNVGDDFVLELIEQGKIPLLSFQKLKGNHAIKKESATFKAKASSWRQIQPGHYYFFGTIRSNRYKWNIPRWFARLHGLGTLSSEMMIQNQKGQSWQVKLNRQNCDGSIYIGSGFTKFAAENNLKEGRKFKMELIRGGNKPIMKFHDLPFEGSV